MVYLKAPPDGEGALAFASSIRLWQIVNFPIFSEYEEKLRDAIFLVIFHLCSF